MPSSIGAFFISTFSNCVMNSLARLGVHPLRSRGIQTTSEKADETKLEYTVAHLPMNSFFFRTMGDVRTRRNKRSKGETNIRIKNAESFGEERLSSQDEGSRRGVSPHTKAKFLPPPFIIVGGLMLALWTILVHRNTKSPLRTSIIGDSNISHLNAFEFWFRRNAWMHQNLTLFDYIDEGRGLRCIGDTPIAQGALILEIPSSMILSRSNTQEYFQGITLERDAEKEIVQRFLGSSRLSDHHFIAMRLLWESCRGVESPFFHYISVMQSKEIPLLFSFNEKELALLQDDDFLAPYARAEARELHEVWGIVAEPMKVLLTNNVGWNHSRCLSLPLYKKFYTLAVSRAMFLDDAFYLVPMADCINHRHHPDVFSTSRERGCNHSKETQTSIFPRYHHRDLKTGSISVRADRDVQAGNQLYEEYDRMDNTGHLVHFGFVLRDNPFHCVVLDFLPFLGDWRPALEQMEWIDTNPCVRVDRTFMNTESINSFMEVVLTLYEWEVHFDTVSPEAREQCQKSLLDPNVGSEQRRIIAMGGTCRIQGVHENLRSMNSSKNDSFLPSVPAPLVRRAAQHAIAKYPTTLVQDWMLLDEHDSSLNSHHGLDPGKVNLALQYRIEEKKLLTALATAVDVAEASGTCSSDELKD